MPKATGPIRLLLVAAAWAAAAPIAAAGDDDWPRFRGPNGTGISEATTVPVRWTEQDHNWRVALPGSGHSSPVLWGQKVFVTATDHRTARQIILCLGAADGQVLWRRDYPSKPHHQHRDNSFASATPAADAERLYVTWTTPAEVTLLALDHAGRQLWRSHLGPFKSMHGSGTSPIVCGETVVLANDQKGKAFLAAMDRRTGQVRWRAERRGGLTPASTPCLYRGGPGPPRLIFTTTAHGVTAIDPNTGQVDWELPGVFLDRCVASPVFAPGVVVGTYGLGNFGTRLVAVRPGSKADNTAPKLLYDLKKAVPLVPTPLVKDGRLFCWDDYGTVTCLDLATGRQLWRERVDGRFYGSPVWVAGRLYCIAKDGHVFVLAAGEKFELPARMPLGEKSFATPAVAGGVMYLRTVSHLISVGGRR